MNDIQVRKREKNQHIQVYVRVRPPNQDEIYGKAASVVELPSPRECVVKERVHDKHTKKFTFDRVFGPLSKQLEVYNAVVNPLLGEVLAGYNCTVFAYGQTGTGKTFTMEGLSNDPAIHWQADSTAGIIPRFLSHLFDELRTMESQEYTVRVSFLELYNEELFDLLSPGEDTSKIRLFEDATKKGAVIIHGLEEVTVHNKHEVYNILKKGSEKRQTAATLMNAHSSRSHTVFSITVHIKENTVDGEELLKTGKLNLVDLAGSENVGRSGAVERRAREAGNINQSLLTLGRVITALVERAPHVPYRESKLTRLLQESLGGRTKTSIIATISSANVNLEETLSTLDYAHRAKNITNRPEINQKMSKKALLKEYTEEIERLRRDLEATRERNGVYMAQDNYNQMQATIDFQEKEIEEKINHIKALEETMAAKEQLLEDLKISLETTQLQVKITEQQRNEQKYLVDNHVMNEQKLFEQAETLLSVAETVTTDTHKLHEKIERKYNIEINNEKYCEQFRKDIAQQIHEIQNNLSNYTRELLEFYSHSTGELSKQTENNSEFLKNSIKHSHNLVGNQKTIIDNSTMNVELLHNNCEKWLDDEINNTSSITNSQRETLKGIAINYSSKVLELVSGKIVDNLRIISEETTTSFDNLLENTKVAMGNLTNKYIHDVNLLKKELNTLLDKRVSKQESREKLEANEKNLEEFFGKYLEQQQQYRAEMIEAEKSEIEAMENADFLVKNITINQENTKTLIDDNLCTDITKITTTLSGGVEENCKVLENIIEKSETIAVDLQKELQENWEDLSRYEDQVKTRGEEQKQQIKFHCNEVLSLIKKDHEMITEANQYLEETTENHCKQLETNFSVINSQFEKQKCHTNHWNGQIATQLTHAEKRIKKFCDEDLTRDTPTGSTPEKREFSYPRKLVVTSPHERLLQRYHEQMKDENPSTSYCDEQTNSISPSSDTAINNQQECSPLNATPPLTDCFVTPKPLSSIKNESSTTRKSNQIMKSSSVSSLTKIPCNTISIPHTKNLVVSKSESDIFNKENGRTSRGSKSGRKTRNETRIEKRILSPRNN